MQRHTELAECPTFAPKLKTRFEELRTQLKGCADRARAEKIAAEACSMVTSLAVRLAPAGFFQIKHFNAAPGNLPELLDSIKALCGYTLSVDRMRPDTLETLTSIYEHSLKKDELFSGEYRHRYFGPRPDELIEAARKGLSFDTVRRRMLIDDADPGHSNDDFE